MMHYTKKLALWDPETECAVKSSDAVTILVNFPIETYLESLLDLQLFLEIHEFENEEDEYIEIDDVDDTFDLIDSQGLKCPKSNQLCKVTITRHGIFYLGINLTTGLAWATRLIPHEEFADAYEIDLNE
tara:strand:- start:120 stop:506 length:387 start_codon:yes stop_codon:yes gene_type:complete